ncbi:MAG: copper chaperone PCu(A)C [Castellaniella sp.]|uniref:copper chaperone PCu(A)C n=1 Tax=Castellaniella sp. TaxID=1955812 RepID=UPI003C774EDF
MNHIGKIVGGLSAGLLLATSAWAADHGAAPAADAPLSTTVKASACWIRQLPAPAPSGGFLVFQNTGDQVKLTGAHSPDYGHVMLHQTTEENGMSKMSMVHQVALPAAGQLEFKPGSYHMMLEQARDGLKVGDHVQVDFALDNGQRVTAQCELKPANTLPGKAGGHQMKH